MQIPPVKGNKSFLWYGETCLKVSQLITSWREYKGSDSTQNGSPVLAQRRSTQYLIKLTWQSSGQHMEIIDPVTALWMYSLRRGSWFSFLLAFIPNLHFDVIQFLSQENISFLFSTKESAFSIVSKDTAVDANLVIEYRNLKHKKERLENLNIPLQGVDFLYSESLIVRSLSEDL